jgi:Domain of unknown function (DUF4010)
LVGIILPLVPDTRFIGAAPVTPFRIWLAVVAVSGLSYATYLLQRYCPVKGGGLLPALFGGIYSSTATTVVLARRQKSLPRNGTLLEGTDEIGTITDRLQRALILDLAGNVAGLRALDVVRRDGELALSSPAERRCSGSIGDRNAGTRGERSRGTLRLGLAISRDPVPASPGGAISRCGSGSGNRRPCKRRSALAVGNRQCAGNNDGITRLAQSLSHKVEDFGRLIGFFDDGQGAGGAGALPDFTVEAPGDENDWERLGRADAVAKSLSV